MVFARLNRLANQNRTVYTVCHTRRRTLVHSPIFLVINCFNPAGQNSPIGDLTKSGREQQRRREIIRHVHHLASQAVKLF